MSSTSRYQQDYTFDSAINSGVARSRRAAPDCDSRTAILVLLASDIYRRDQWTALATIGVAEDSTPKFYIVRAS
jgi:hypothetical protein